MCISTNTLPGKPHGSFKEQFIRRDAGRAYKPSSFGNLELVRESIGRKNTNTDRKIGMVGIFRSIQKQAFRFYSSKHGFNQILEFLEPIIQQLVRRNTNCQPISNLINPSIYEGNLALCGVPLPKRCLKFMEHRRFLVQMKIRKMKTGMTSYGSLLAWDQVSSWDFGEFVAL